MAAMNLQLAVVPAEGRAGAYAASATSATAAGTTSTSGATVAAGAECSGSTLTEDDGFAGRTVVGRGLSPLPAPHGTHQNLDVAVQWCQYLPCEQSTSANQLLGKDDDTSTLLASAAVAATCSDWESPAGGRPNFRGSRAGSSVAEEDPAPEAVTRQCTRKRLLDGFIDVLSLDEVTVLKWPRDMVCYTAAQPSVSYCCNPLHFDFRAGTADRGGSSPLRSSVPRATVGGDVEGVVSKTVEDLIVAIESVSKATVSCSATAAASDLTPLEADPMACNGLKPSSEVDVLFACKTKVGSSRRHRQYRWKKKNAGGGDRSAAGIPNDDNGGKGRGATDGASSAADDGAEGQQPELVANHSLKDKHKKRKRKKKKKEKKHKKCRRSPSTVTKSHEAASIAVAADDSELRPPHAGSSASGQTATVSTDVANGACHTDGRKRKKRKGHKRKAKGSKAERHPERPDGGVSSHGPASAAIFQVVGEHDLDMVDRAADPAVQPKVVTAVPSCLTGSGCDAAADSATARGGMEDEAGKSLADSCTPHRPKSADGVRKKPGLKSTSLSPASTTASNLSGRTASLCAAGAGAAPATASVLLTAAAANHVATLASSRPSEATAPQATADGAADGVVPSARVRKQSEGQSSLSVSGRPGAQSNDDGEDVPQKRIKIAFRPAAKGAATADRAVLEPTVVSRWDSSSSSDSEDEQRRRATLHAILDESRSSSCVGGRHLGELHPADAAATSLGIVAAAEAAAVQGPPQKPPESGHAIPELFSSADAAQLDRDQAAHRCRRAAGTTGGPDGHVGADTVHLADLPTPATGATAAGSGAAAASAPVVSGHVVRGGGGGGGVSSRSPERSNRSRSTAKSPSHRHRDRRLRSSTAGRGSRSSTSSSERSRSRRRSGGRSRSSSSRRSWSSRSSRSRRGSSRGRQRRRRGRRSSRRRSSDSGGSGSSSSNSRRSRRSASRRRRHRRHRQRTYSSSADRSYSSSDASSSPASHGRSRSRRHRRARRRRYRSSSRSSGSVTYSSSRSRSGSGRRPASRRRCSPSRSSLAAPFGSLLPPSSRRAPGAAAAAKRLSAAGLQRPGVGARKPPYKPAGAVQPTAAVGAPQAEQPLASRSQAPTAHLAPKQQQQQPPLHDQAAVGGSGDSRTSPSVRAGNGNGPAGGAGGSVAAIASRSPSNGQRAAAAVVQSEADAQQQSSTTTAAAVGAAASQGGVQQPFIGPLRPGERQDMAVPSADIPLPAEMPMQQHSAAGSRQSPQQVAATAELPGHHQRRPTSPAAPTTMLMPPEQTEMYRGLQEQAELYRELREQQQRMRDAALRQGQSTGATELGIEDGEQQPAPHEAVVQSYAQQIIMSQRKTMFPQPAAPSPPPVALFGPTAALHQQVAAAAAAAASQVPAQAGLPLQAGSPVVLAGPSPAAAAAAAMHAQMAAVHAHHQQQQQQLVAQAQAVAHMQQLQAAAAGGLPLHLAGHPGLLPASALGGLPGMSMGAHPLHGFHMSGLGPAPGPGGLAFSHSGLSHLMGPAHPALSPAGPQMLQLGPQLVHLPMGAPMAGGGQPMVMIQGSPHILFQRIPRGL